MKQRDWKLYGLWILFVEAVGALSGWLTREGAAQYEQTIVQPPLSPLGIVFPIVWGILFALMGISAARVDTSPASPARTRGLAVFWFSWPSTFSGAFCFSISRPSALHWYGWRYCGSSSYG